MKEIYYKITLLLLGIVIFILPIRFLYLCYQYLKYGFWQKLTICYFEESLCKTSWIGLNEILQYLDFSFIVFVISISLVWLINFIEKN
jgi:hypothetical protein